MKTTLLFIALTIGYIALSQQTSKTIVIQGVSRSYIEYMPSNYQNTEHLPLIFVLHGLGGNNSQMTQIGFNQIADTARFIVLYPQGLNNNFNQAAWNNGTGVASNAKDVEFINTLISLYETDKNVDPYRVYATGFSMGSIMSHRLALKLNNRIAAIGTMAGTMSTVDSQSPTPAYFTPVIHLHGTADQTVPYDSDPLVSLTLVPETMAFWTGIHECSSGADSSRILDSANDDITIDRFIYNNCNQDNAVELWRFNNADHIYLYEPVNDITESKVIWNFFRKWQHPNPSLANLKESSSIKTIDVYPNPSNGLVKFSLNEDQEIVIVNKKGQSILELKGKKGANSFHINAEKGTYFLKAASTSIPFILH